MSTHARMSPWWLLTPSLLLFGFLLIVPLALTAILSFNVFDHATGVKNEFTLAHYAAVLTDEYYYGIFWRTFWISGLVTLICLAIGAPEAYVLSRMKNPWRSVFLLVVLAPLLVSVVVRAFGWSMLLGPQGLVNQALQVLGMGPVRTGIEVTVLVVGWLLGGTVGLGTVLYAVAIGPLVHLFLPMCTVRLSPRVSHRV